MAASLLSDRRFLAGVAAGVGAAGLAALLAARAAGCSACTTTTKPGAGGDGAAASTTSSAHGNAVYETAKAVAEYLQFHYADADLLPYAVGPHEALNFASRTATVCVDWAKRTGTPLDAALDVGCAVGRTAVDLTPHFARVVGLDYSHAFVDAAAKLVATGSAAYVSTVEGDITERRIARLPAGAVAARVSFLQGDACALPTNAALGGPFTVVHAANLICRLPDPRKFLARLPTLVAPRGLVVLATPFSWLPQYTPRDKWLGGTVDAATGVAKRSVDGLSDAMAGLGFKLLHSEEAPFLIREHVRKYQWGCSLVTVWQKAD